jgi:hypothetical protein
MVVSEFKEHTSAVYRFSQEIQGKKSGFSVAFLPVDTESERLTVKE